MFEALAAEVDRLGQTDPCTLADGESVIELHRLRDRLDAAVVRVSAAYDATGDWSADGALSLAAWLSTRCHLPLPSARAEVALGRALRQMDLVEGAWLSGRIGRAQAAALARARTPATEKAFERDEERLVDAAAELRFRSFCRRLGYWRMVEDREGAEDDAQRRRGGRRLHISQSFEDMFFVDGVLDPVNGTIIYEAHAPRTGAVRGRLGRGPGPAGRRGHGQRPPPHPGPAPGRRLGRDGRPFSHRSG